MKRKAAVAAALLCLSAASPNAADEARSRALFGEIRCVVCQNESIESSQAEIAADLRSVVREQVAAGRTDAEIREYLVARYGEFVLFRPAFSAGNALLWLGPFLVVLGGGAALLLRARSMEARSSLDGEEMSQPAAAPSLEPDERNVT